MRYEAIVAEFDMESCGSHINHEALGQVPRDVTARYSAIGGMRRER